MYKVVEIAGKLGKSKTAIYNKLNENPGLFKGHISKVESIRMIDNEGLEILKELFNLKEVESEVETQLETESLKFNNTNGLIEVETLVSELKDRIKYLEDESKETRELLKIQSKQLENFQVLLLNEQKKNHLLESQGEEVAVTEDKKKSFWDRFKKKWGK